MKYLPQIIELADGTKCVYLEDFRRECDEAREAIRALAEHGESEIQRITKERDEARAITKEAITGLYNLGDYDLANTLSGKLEGPK
jgi:hypothetical protein